VDLLKDVDARLEALETERFSFLSTDERQCFAKTLARLPAEHC